MPDESLREVMESIRTRVQAELDGQLSALSERHQAAIAAARAEVEQRVASEVTKVRIEADRHLADESSRLRAEADRRVAAAAAITAQLDAGTLLQAFREIAAATTASDILAAIAKAAAGQKPPASLFVANGARLDRWAVDGVGSAGREVTGDQVLGSLTEALKTGRVVRDNGTSVAAPLLLDGTAVGVLHGTKTDGSPEAWAETLEAVATYGAARLGYLTALRTAQARELIGRQPPSADGEEDAQSARRYARLVVSEIKLYNEAAVREGRIHRDLLRRLAPEVDRARRLYEERVPSTVPDRGRHFHQELVQTLAGGDPSLLG